MNAVPDDYDDQSVLDNADLNEIQVQVVADVRRQAEAKLRRQAKLDGEPAMLAASPFQALGFDRKAFFIYSAIQAQVLIFTARDLNSASELMTLAPEAWWAEAFPPSGRQTGTFNVASAANYLIRQCQSAGVYQRTKLRGVGAWMDEGRQVLHLGDRLIVDGMETEISKIRSDWRYEQAERIRVNTKAQPATFEQCALLIDACAGIAWSNPERDPRILAGWILIGFVPGLLPWRPHLWITSEIGEGKTFVAEQLVAGALGDIARVVASKSTEPGLRRYLKNDARPVIFDEAEGDSSVSQRRVESILEYMRQSSSDSTAAVVQAVSGASEEVLIARPKFIGCLSSVHLSLSQPADISRFVSMGLRTATEEEIAESERRLAALFVPGISDRLFALSLARVPQILANHRVLRDAIARHGNKRAGDTLGIILAGFQALLHDRRLTAEEATEMVKEATWLQEAAQEQVPQKEWRRLGDFIAQQRFRFANGSNAPSFDMSVGEACSLMGPEREAEEHIARSQLERTLGQQGFRVDHTPDGWRVSVANNSAQMAKWLHGQPWEQSWRATLLRMPGASRSNKTLHFPGMGASQRATQFPLGVLLGRDDQTTNVG